MPTSMESPHQKLFIAYLLLFLLALQHSCECSDSSESSPHFRSSSSDEFRETNKRSAVGDTEPIPLQFYKELDNVSDMSEFIDRFVDLNSTNPQLGIQENIKRSVERAASVIPKPANCIPDNTIVPLIPLNPSNDPKVIYYPKCTRVKRCGGCCGSELMSCQPTELEVVNFEVTKYRYGERIPVTGKEIIPIEVHKRCSCACRIKEEDCNAYQIYRPELCRCLCTNDDALQKCLGRDHKTWDDQNCRCVCRDSKTCTTGTIFDENQCECVDPNAVIKTGSPVQDRRKFIVQAIPIETDNSTLYEL